MLPDNFKQDFTDGKLTAEQFCNVLSGFKVDNGMDQAVVDLTFYTKSCDGSCLDQPNLGSFLEVLYNDARMSGFTFYFAYVFGVQNDVKYNTFPVNGPNGSCQCSGLTVK